MSCKHDYEMLDVIQVVGWDEDDLPFPCLLEVAQCNKCGIVDEYVSEGNLELDNQDPYDMMEW